MSDEVVSIIVLVGIFLIATVLPIHMGVLGLIAAFVVGQAVADQSVDDVLGGFPGDLFVTLVGVTYLFAIARNNGTVDWLVAAAVRAVGGRVALIPWVMFVVTGVLTAVGAVVPAAVAIIAPIGLGFAIRYRINPILMGLLIINGASAGGFSPISVFGSIVNGVVERNDLDGSPTLLFLASLIFNFLLSIVVFLLFGGRELLKRKTAAFGGEGAQVAEEEVEESAGPSRHPHGASRGGVAGAQTLPRYAPDREDEDEEEEKLTLDRDRTLTLVGIAALVVSALAFDLEVGFVALTVGGLLALVSPQKTKEAVGQVAWPTVLLICGIVTYVALLENIGTVDFLGDQVADLGAPLLSALLICYIGGAVSAFASTTGILGALIPLAVPFLLAGEVGAVALIIALSLSSSVVDSSPFSTSGALVVANAPEERRDEVFRNLMRWGFSMVAIAPLVTWLLLVVPGEL